MACGAAAASRARADRMPAWSARVRTRRCGPQATGTGSRRPWRQGMRTDCRRLAAAAGGALRCWTTVRSARCPPPLPTPAAASACAACAASAACAAYGSRCSRRQLRLAARAGGTTARVCQRVRPRVALVSCQQRQSGPRAPRAGPACVRHAGMCRCTRVCAPWLLRALAEPSRHRVRRPQSVAASRSDSRAPAAAGSHWRAILAAQN